MKESTVVRTRQFEILTAKVGAFVLVRVRGRYVDDLLLSLRRGVFNQKANFAIDLSGLADIAMPLARELYFLSQNLKGTEQRLVLVRPPEKIQSLLSLLSTTPLPAVFSENDLTMDPAKTEAKIVEQERELSRVRAEIQNNPVWQQFHREGGWVCPYCGRVQEDIRIVTRANVGPAALEGIYRHVWQQCPLFRPGASYRPLTELQNTLRNATSQRLAVTQKDVAFMETKLSALETKAKKADALEQSLKVASARQKRLLPEKAPQIEGTEIGLLYRPAEKVSGDFYDFIAFPDGKLGLIIGDVAGHGIEAAILMGMSKKVLALRFEELGDPIETVRRANQDLYRELDRQLFVTAFVALLDPKAMTLTYARAGHNPPILYHPARSPAERLLEVGGLGIGMSQGSIFDRALQGETVSLQSQEFLLLYTDGVVEARNKLGEEFETGRITAILEQNASKSSNYILGILGHEFDRFIAGLPQEDDVTIVCVKLA